MQEVERDADGVARYADRPASLAHLLRKSVDRDAAASTIVEVGGGLLTYGELWDRAARVASGLRGGGVGRGDRVAIRLQNGVDWVPAFFGAQLAGAVVVPVNARFRRGRGVLARQRLRERLYVCTGRRHTGRGPLRRARS
jgi:acyl-CoA synthetase (AMP-forming)/AMP-acid ligase II